MHYRIKDLHAVWVLQTEINKESMSSEIQKAIIDNYRLFFVGMVSLFEVCSNVDACMSADYDSKNRSVLRMSNIPKVKP